MLELVIVLAIMSILIAVSIPSILNWRQGLVYRETAREVASMLREAKSRAITNNLEQQIVFSPYSPGVSTQYEIRPGNQAYSTNWHDYGLNPLPSNWTILDYQVKIMFAVQIPPLPSLPPATDPAGSIQFTPNGAASAWGIIKIKDQNLVTRFCVIVIPIGRISVIGPDPVNCT
jgi:Tfp pilus assembly protein FimT